MSKIIHQEIAGKANEVKELLGNNKGTEAYRLWTAFTMSCAFKFTNLNSKTEDSKTGKDITIESVLESCLFDRNIVSILGNTIFVNGIALPKSSKNIIGVDNITFIFTRDQIKSGEWFNFEPVEQGKSQYLFGSEGDDNAVSYPKGLTVVPAAAKSGKSLLMAKLASDLNVPLINWGEPDSASLPSAAVVMWAAITIACNVGDDVVLDSWKDLLNFFKENLTSGGVSRDISAYISSMSNTFARNKMSLFVAVNPGTQNQNALDELGEMFIGAASAIIEPQSVGSVTSDGLVSDHTLRVYDRYSYQREEREVTVSYSLNKLKTFDSLSEKSYDKIRNIQDDIDAIKMAGEAFVSESPDNGKVLGEGLSISSFTQEKEVTDQSNDSDTVSIQSNESLLDSSLIGNSTNLRKGNNNEAK
jgi:hypothetical protein